MTGRPRRLRALVTAAAGFALAACGAGGEGTVTEKAGPVAYDHACQAGGTMISPVAFPVWGSCAGQECWRLVVRDSNGTTSEACVSRDEYDRTQLGAFWHGRTDR